MELYRFVPIADVKLEELEDLKDYTCFLIDFKTTCSRTGGYIKHHNSAKVESVLLPYTPPEQKIVTDEEIYGIAESRHLNTADHLWDIAMDEFQEGYKKAMRDQLSSKSDAIDNDFVIQKMNELVNDILCKPNYSHLHRLLKLTPDSNKIALFIDRWAKENDIFKNQTK